MLQTETPEHIPCKTDAAAASVPNSAQNSQSVYSSNYDNQSLLEAAIQQKLRAMAGAASKPRQHPEKRPDKGAPAMEDGGSAPHTRDIIGRTVGPFRFTAKQPSQKSGGRFGGWEVFCPFHRKNYKSGCRKWFGLCGPTLKDKQECAAAALEWCAAAHQFDRQWLHLAYQVDYAAAAPASVTRRLPIFMEDAPTERCIPDSELQKETKAGEEANCSGDQAAAAPRKRPLLASSADAAGPKVAEQAEAPADAAAATGKIKGSAKGKGAQCLKRQRRGRQTAAATHHTGTAGRAYFQLHCKVVLFLLFVFV